MKHQHIFAALAAALVLAATGCGSQKTVVGGDIASANIPTGAPVKPSKGAAAEAFIQKAAAARIYAQNVTADMTFTLRLNGKEVSVPGTLRMRKGVVIRLQLTIPLIGTEVGRIEFTPDHVLIIDRLHKQYVRESYANVDFLAENGINFVTLQSLFRNELFLPGSTEQVRGKDITQFEADLTGATNEGLISASKGDTKYVWQANRASGQITKAQIDYRNAQRGAASLVWEYADFRALGVKMFPTRQTFTLGAGSAAKAITISLRMSDVGTDDKWDPTTTVSDRYQKVDARQVLEKLTAM